MFTLRDLRVDSVNTCENLKEIILSQVGETTVADTDEFQMDFSENLKNYGSTMIVMLVMHRT